MRTTRYPMQGRFSPATVAAAADEGVAAAQPCTIGVVWASNVHADTDVFLMLFDLVAVPANGVAPRVPAIKVAAGQAIFLPPLMLVCANGFVWAASSTADVLTITNINPLQVSVEVG